MSVGRIEEFDGKSGNWTAYIKRMEMYFVVNAIEDKKIKGATLIAVIGEGAYDLSSALASQTSPSTMDYNAVLTLVRNHLKLAPSKWMVRYIFRQRTQNVGEPINEYIAELWKLAKRGEFGSMLQASILIP